MPSEPGVTWAEPLATGAVVPPDGRAPNFGSLDTMEGLLDAFSSISFELSHGGVSYLMSWRQGGEARQREREREREGRERKKYFIEKTVKCLYNVT